MARDRKRVASIVHDCKNALFSALGGLELLRKRLPNDKESVELYELVRRHVDEIARLTQELQEAESSELDSDKVPLGDDIAGLRVLVVEDEALIRMLIEDYLGQLDCRSVGFASTVDAALQMTARTDMDLVLLDINLAGRQAEQVARALDERAMPFVFMTGYGAVPKGWENRPRLQKPFGVDELRREMSRARGAATGTRKADAAVLNR